MFLLINQMIIQFRKCFNRERTWKWFVVHVMGLMVRLNMRGVTSSLSALQMESAIYKVSMDFFRSDAYEVTKLYENWINMTVCDECILRISDRIVIDGDHTKVSKEGRRMPGLQVHHQESENSGKGEFITGHLFAQLGAIMTNGETSRNIPIYTERQEVPPRKEGSKKPDGDTIVVQMGKLATKTAKIIYDTTGERSIGVFDGYFCKKSMFNTTNLECSEDGKPILNVVTRAQDNCVGFVLGVQAIPGQKRGRGRPKKAGKNVYGEKINLKLLLKDKSNFTKTTMKLYGKNTAVEYRCLDLLWRPTDSMMRFVVLSSNRGQCILMTDDLTLTPEEIITIYCLRFKIETSFDEQKNIYDGS